MTRPIVFRAFDKKERKWLSVTDINWYQPETGNTGICGVVVRLDGDRDKFMLLEDVELVQFTGLLDKNGKEIYEGDILSNEHNAKWPVRWDDDEARFTNVANYAKHREIIGNIYENADLLPK